MSSTARGPRPLSRYPTATANVTNTTPKPIKKTNLERYNKVMELVKKKTLIKLTLSDTERELLKFTWGEKETSERSISYMITSTPFWERVYELLSSNSLNINLTSIRHLTLEFPGILQMAILNLQDLSRLDDYLANLGRRHRRIFGIDTEQFYHLGNAMIDTMMLMDSGNMELEEVNLVIDVWTKLYCFLANSIIQSYLNDPKILCDSDDPFQITNIDVELILGEHFQSTVSRPNDDHDSGIRGADHLSLHPTRTNDTLFTQDTRLTSIMPEITSEAHDVKSEMATIDIISNNSNSTIDTDDDTDTNFNDDSISELNVIPEAAAHQEASDDDDFDDDDTGVYDIFKDSETSIASSATSILSRTRSSIQTKHQSFNFNSISYAQSQRRPTQLLLINDSQNSNNGKSKNGSKKMGFFKRMAVKAS